MKACLVLNDYGNKLLKHEIMSPCYSPIKQTQLAKMFFCPIVNKVKPLDEFLYLLPIECDDDMKLVSNIVYELTNWKLSPQDYLFIRVYGINDVRIKGSFKSSFKILLNHYLEYDAIFGENEEEHNKWAELFRSLKEFQNEVNPKPTDPVEPEWISVIQPFIYDYSTSPKYQEFLSKLNGLIANSDLYLPTDVLNKFKEVVRVLTEIKDSRLNTSNEIYQNLVSVVNSLTNNNFNNDEESE